MKPDVNSAVLLEPPILTFGRILDQTLETTSGIIQRVPLLFPHSFHARRNEFSKNKSLDKKDFAAIEYLLRKGHRQLETYSSPGIKSISFESSIH